MTHSSSVHAPESAPVRSQVGSARSEGLARVEGSGGASKAETALWVSVDVEPEPERLSHGLALPAHALPPGLPADMADCDWDDLFHAVKARLRLTVDPGFDRARDSAPQALADRVRVGVLECVAALDQLHLTLNREAARREWLEREVADAQSALARACAELVGTQAGERRARYLAAHDSLTSLPNRRLFRERLDQALADAGSAQEPLAVLYLDLDGFKPINDSHGHQAGDELLRIVAARLTRAVRAEDMVSRIGGDEFACLIVGMSSREHLSHLACKLLDAVSAPSKVGAFEFSVRPSIGITMYPADGTTTEALLKAADAAMYRAKRQQTGYAFFDERADVWTQGFG
jgi:diguanylate cyclase (GGDEF)-like protein